MNLGRQLFLDGGYHYMLVLESDLFPEEDCLRRLMSHQKPVVGSYYLLGHKADTIKYKNTVGMYRRGLINYDTLNVLTKDLVPEVPCLFVLDKTKGNAAGIGTRILTIQEGVSIFGTGLRMIHGCGLGCTLIRREIVERFPFWTDNTLDNKHHDVYFYLDLHNARIPVFVDTDVLVKHKPSRWDDVKDM